MSDLWSLAQEQRSTQVFSTLFPARSVERQLSTEEGIAEAIAWCRATAVTKVYVESFRDGLMAKAGNLERARDRFREAGIEASGCVTTTRMVDAEVKGKQYFPCFTHLPTQEQLEEIFAFTASRFEEIMIDDFYCTTCECEECQAARGERSWAEYRRELMNRLSRERVLGPARRANPKCQVIIKYPQWYEEFHERGYDVDTETELFDRIWVGTECRDINDQEWGGCATYRPFWIMRWLGQIGGAKCGGGWYDPYGTHEDSYLEQARQTILGGARESLLFCYPSLRNDTGPANIEALRGELPKLYELAAWVAGERPRGIGSYKPMNSSGGADRYLFDWLGMIGLPVIPTHQFPDKAEVALLSAHACADVEIASKYHAFSERGGRSLLTPSAAERVGDTAQAAHIFTPPGNPRELMQLPAEQIAPLRKAALEPLGLALDGPAGVALYLLGEDKVALESFNDEAVEMRLQWREGARLALALGRPGAEVEAKGGEARVRVPARSLVGLVSAH